MIILHMRHCGRFVSIHKLRRLEVGIGKLLYSLNILFEIFVRVMRQFYKRIF